MKRIANLTNALALASSLSIVFSSASSHAALTARECRHLFRDFSQLQKPYFETTTMRFNLDRFTPASRFETTAKTVVQTAVDSKSNQMASIERMSGSSNPLAKEAHTHIRISEVSKPKADPFHSFDSRPVVALARARLVGGGEELVPVRIEPWDPMHPSHSLYRQNQAQSRSTFSGGFTDSTGAPLFRSQSNPISPSESSGSFTVLLPMASAISATGLTGVFLVGTTTGKVWLVGRGVEPVEVVIGDRPKFTFSAPRSTTANARPQRAESVFEQQYVKNVRLEKVPNPKFLGFNSYTIVVTRPNGRTEHYDLSQAALDQIAAFAKAVSTAP